MKTATQTHYFRLALISTILALTVVMLGAYTRLADAGLGCPDWPGCYGQLLAPHTEHQIQQAVQAFPDKPVESAKAWAEMVHRYFAGTLGLIILALAIWAIVIQARGMTMQPVKTPLLLVVLVAFQAILGMWTVTWLVLPAVVTAHLIMGMCVAALLWYVTLSSGQLFLPPEVNVNRFKPWAIIALMIVMVQIFLGAWTSTNYASIICPDFPFCRGSLFPAMNFQQAFNFASPIGIDYQGGRLDTAARTALQMTHRYGAFVTAGFLFILSLTLINSSKQTKLQNIGWIIFLLLFLQFSLGVANVQLSLPMFVAVAHNGVAALLLLSLVTLIYKLYQRG